MLTGECVETTWYRGEAGYGRKSRPRRPDGSRPGVLLHHREVMRELHVPIAGMVVRHHCDNPSCVNPDHLTVGTQGDNVRDMVDRGRRVAPPIKAGEECHLAKLNEYAVRWIRSYYATGDYSQGEVGEMFGILQPHVSRIVRRESWRHVA